MTRQAAMLGDDHGGALAVSELCFEDFEAGQMFQLGQRVVSREEIVSFARRYDPQPVHIDERAARVSMLNGLAASGWHSCAVFMRLLSDGLLANSRYAGLVAVEQIRWLLPLRPGDALSGRVTCLGSTMSSPWPGLGAVTFACEALNGRGERVMSWIAHCAFGRRGGKERRAAAALSRARTSAVVRNPGEHGLKYFEDIRLGDEIAIGQSRFCPDEISAFSRNYDPRSAHPGGSGRACASGWHVTAVWMQRLVRYYLREAHKLRARGQPVPQLGPSPGMRHMRWLHPVHAGDVLTFRTWAERKIDLPAWRGWGLSIGGSDVTNQHGDTVVSFYAQLLLERRNKARGTALSGA